MQDKRVKRIVLPYGAIRKIAARLGVHENTVRDALSFTSSTELQQRIREMAQTEFGGHAVWMTNE